MSTHRIDMFSNKTARCVHIECIYHIPHPVRRYKCYDAPYSFQVISVDLIAHLFNDSSSGVKRQGGLLGTFLREKSVLKGEKL